MTDNKPMIIESLPCNVLNHVRSKVRTYDDYWDELIEDEPKELTINKI